MRETTAKRLKRIMEERNLKQVDLLNLVTPIANKYNVKITKSNISYYCSGKNIPKQDKLFILAEALGVSEIYLMGFDENSLNNTDIEVTDPILDAKISNDKELKEIIKKYYSLSSEKQKLVVDFINMLSRSTK